MHEDQRGCLLGLLGAYKPISEEEKSIKVRMVDFVTNNPECFENDFKIGHITGSALVCDESLVWILLTHHSVLDKWFQFGGHSDGHFDALATGMREAQEESGLKSLRSFPGHEGIFDIDIHAIPAKGNMPEHNHFDVRRLLVADMNEPIVVSHESKDVKWVKMDDAAKYNSNAAFLRLVGKANKLRELC